MSVVPRRKRITKHTFVLYGNDKLHFKHDTEATFRPPHRRKPAAHAPPPSRSILPTFLNDRKFFTYAFHLPAEATDNDQEMLEDHCKRAQEACLELSEMLYPKPRSKNKYCGVCRAHYDDYKDHVEADPHLAALRKSPYQALIQQFCGRVQALLAREEEVKAEQSTMEELEDKSFECEAGTPSKFAAC